jgi:[ribosomal protein S5]-alanine N-acetyltransferase
VTVPRDPVRTARLLLRRAVPDDLAAFHEILSDARAMRYWSRPEHETREESQGFVNFLCGCPDNGGDDWVLDLDGRAIGKAGSWAPPEVGFILHPDHWGHGYAFEAMSALVPLLFARHDVPALVAEVDPRNSASLALLARLGFRETGRAERTLRWRDEWCDSVYLALPRPGRRGGPNQELTN